MAVLCPLFLALPLSPEQTGTSTAGSFSLWHDWHLELDNSLLWELSYNMVGCLAGSLACKHEIQVTSLLVMTTTMSARIAKCPSGDSNDHDWKLLNLNISFFILSSFLGTWAPIQLKSLAYNSLISTLFSIHICFPLQEKYTICTTLFLLMSQNTIREALLSIRENILRVLWPATDDTNLEKWLCLWIFSFIKWKISD